MWHERCLLFTFRRICVLKVSSLFEVRSESRESDALQTPYVWLRIVERCMQKQEAAEGFHIYATLLWHSRLGTTCTHRTFLYQLAREGEYIEKYFTRIIELSQEHNTSYHNTYGYLSSKFHQISSLKWLKQNIQTFAYT